MVSIFVRASIVKSHCERIDAKIQSYYENGVRRSGAPSSHVVSKSLLFTRVGDAINMSSPQWVACARGVFMLTLSALNRRGFVAIQALGLTAFAVHVISIGLSELMTQIYTICLLVVPTVLLTFRFGCLDSPVGNWLRNMAPWASSRSRPETLLSARESSVKFQTIRSYSIGRYIQVDIMKWPDAFAFYWPPGERPAPAGS